MYPPKPRTPKAQANNMIKGMARESGLDFARVGFFSRGLVTFIPGAPTAEFPKAGELPYDEEPPKVDFIRQALHADFAGCEPWCGGYGS